MYRKIEDFVNAYRQQREGTQGIFDALTDQNLGQQIHDDHRTLGRIAWHLVTAIPEMMNRVGLEISSVEAEAPMPSSARAIQQAFREASQELITAVASKWEDETLLETDDMYGMTWPRGYTLAALVGHETHHRGQMTVLLRQAGAKVPGVMGPSREEWGQHGMEAPSI